MELSGGGKLKRRLRCGPIGVGVFRLVEPEDALKVDLLIVGKMLWFSHTDLLNHLTLSFIQSD